ncbi:hypothetical protein OFR20_05600 [Brachyspira hyodysenteriae]|uniref:hypothetical protein n=1 Tax=Brachyspira hyodysenteriae TaxID=159 RepID=UPI0022CD57DE|nr:hypothetical protein [Brachyspira hyodysenteriae]MCZ9980996.1 hypothetical protein [Brachyspira hyodysenteriae]
MLDFKVMKIIMEEVSKGLENFDNYLESIEFENIDILKKIKFSENIKSLIENGILTDGIIFNLKCEVIGIKPTFVLTQKGIKILTEIRNGNINSIEDLYSFNHMIIENKPVFNNNPNINVSPIFNNTNNISSENNNISNIETYSDLRLFVENNSNIENKTEIVNLIRELEEAKDNENKEDYIDKFLKLLELLENVLPIPPAIIKGAKTAKKFFDAIKNKNND